ncbi:MAG TPA: hypothetical protein DEP28_05295 [Bacteroidetes bacterium]|nr:hypothetical protein [Bacteroidota bacterium]HCN38644.1 hypothetical protein [Bacteroidota bacterium]
MKKIKLLIFCLLALNTLKSQTVTEIITDRPDATESAFTIPVYKLQIEGGFEYSRNKETVEYLLNSTQERSDINIKTPTLLLRYGLNDITELRAGIEYITNKVEYSKSPDINSNSGDFQNLTIGAKFKIGEAKGWIPESAVIVEGGFPLLVSKTSKSIIPSIVFCFENELSDRLSLTYNLGAEGEGEDGSANLLYTISLGADISKNVGVFVENFGQRNIQLNNVPVSYIDGGLSFLAKNNLQFDVYGGTRINKNTNEFFVGAGVSYRIPN